MCENRPHPHLEAIYLFSLGSLRSPPPDWSAAEGTGSCQFCGSISVCPISACAGGCAFCDSSGSSYGGGRLRASGGLSVLPLVERLKGYSCAGERAGGSCRDCLPVFHPRSRQAQAGARSGVDLVCASGNDRAVREVRSDPTVVWTDRPSRFSHPAKRANLGSQP